jgi:hypothetical protein
MHLTRSLGGIGKLYRDDACLGEVYYNIKPNQRPGQLLCTIVFVGKDLDLPNDNRVYRLYLEDGRYLIVTLRKVRQAHRSPYNCISCDGILHSEYSYSMPKY